MSLYDQLSGAGKTLYQKVASIFGGDNIILTSTKRNRNDNSQHNTGDAFDFKIRGLSNQEAFDKLMKSGLEYRQLIDEINGPASSGPHIHIGAGSGNQNMIYKDGKYIPIHSAAGKATEYPEYKSSGISEGTFEEWINKNLWGIEPGTYSVGSQLGRLIAIILGVAFVGLAIAAFVFKSETAAKVIDAVNPVSK